MYGKDLNESSFCCHVLQLFQCRIRNFLSYSRDNQLITSHKPLLLFLLVTFFFAKNTKTILTLKYKLNLSKNWQSCFVFTWIHIQCKAGAIPSSWKANMYSANLYFFNIRSDEQKVWRSITSHRKKIATCFLFAWIIRNIQHFNSPKDRFRGLIFGGQN